MDMEIRYQPIGIIHSPFCDVARMPIQPCGAKGVAGTVELYAEFSPGLLDLDGFSHIILLYHLHRAPPPKLKVTPFLDSRPHGVFATRAPSRPNPLGLSVVRLQRVDGNTLHIENVDILDGTPLLDIKPHVPEFDCGPAERIGWLEQARQQMAQVKSDERFR